MDLGFLRSLYESQPDQGSTGYVSVYLDTSRQTENTDAEMALRWRSAREELARAGAGAATLDAAEQAVTARARQPQGMAVFARGEAVPLATTLPGPPVSELTSFAPLPHVMPLLARLPRHVPHVRVGADRAGGTVLAVTDAGMTGRAQVDGESWPVHKVSAGGWSEARLQRSAEETWADNAKRIAGSATAAAERVHAEFVLVGGDVRERSLVLDSLPKALRETTVTVDREVAPDSAVFGAAAEAEAARRRDAESRARVDEFRVRVNDADPRSRRAVEGLDGTLAALRDGLVAELLIAGEAASDVAVWIGPGLADAATAKEQLTARGITPLGTDRADEALARAAAATGASLFFIPAGADRPRDRVAALLRAPLAAAL